MKIVFRKVKGRRRRQKTIWTNELNGQKLNMVDIIKNIEG